MPVYEYGCEAGHRFEVKQRFSDAPITTCQVCALPVTKLISASGISFKGSGWYVTDYSNKMKNPEAQEKSSDKSSDKSSEKSSEKSPEKSQEKSDAPQTSTPAAQATPESSSPSKPDSSSSSKSNGGSSPSPAPASPTPSGS
jgi:putative FmdB family regulatory protein